MRGSKKGMMRKALEKEGVIGDAFSPLAKKYRGRWGIALCAVDPDGRIVKGRAACSRGACENCDSARAFAVREALRWGEPTVSLCPLNALLWAIPLMQNEEIRGGLLATVKESRAFSQSSPLDIRAACRDLRRLAEESNLTNASALRWQRQIYEREQERAYAIHALKREQHNTIRELYIREEPSLFAAIRAGDRAEARRILNRILVAIHHHAGERLELVKSHFLELVVTMCRTAVEGGGAPAALLGANYEHMREVASIDAEEDLAAWFRATLERLMDAIGDTRQRNAGALVFEALNFMERHCDERLSRNDVAKAVHLSPSHFAAILKRETGMTFTTLLNQMRVNHAAVLLARSEKSLSLVALESGFRDQAYFTNVFRRYRRMTPLKYRRSVRASAP